MINDILTIDRFPSGPVVLPPSKSVGHRALICSALAGSGMVIDPGYNDDIEATLRCLNGLGFGLAPVVNKILHENGKRPLISDRQISCGPGLPPVLLDCGESGSTLRFLIPLAALSGREVAFTGRGRLMERPVYVYEQCMKDKGVTFRYQRVSQSAPSGEACSCGTEKHLVVRGPLQPGEFHLPGGVSSQFITGLLLALPLLTEDSRIIMDTPLQSASYVDLTLAVLKDFGMEIENHNHTSYFVPGNQTYQPRYYQVEADFSGAAFFLAAAALGRPVELMGLNLNSKQGDRAFLDLLVQAGHQIKTGPGGGLTVCGPARPKPLTVDVGDIPDLVPPLAALLAFADGESRIVNAGRLRIKESDRLATVTRQLNNLGADITEGDDYLIIRGKSRLTGGQCSGENDHRIAMMCAVAAIGAEQPVTISDCQCVKKSYPDFWNDFMKEAIR